MDPQVNEARAFAIARHQGQLYGTQDYSVHLADVFALVSTAYPEDIPLQAAAWLHDVLEDTSETRLTLSKMFGAEVSDLVWAVTGEGSHRAARKASVLAKLARLPKAVLLKLADRLCNVRRCAQDSNSRLLAMYRDEQPEYRQLFAQTGALVWLNELEGLLGC